MRPSVLLSTLIVVKQLCSPISATMNDNTTSTFLYFAYGSNLLQQRLHINNPSAKRYKHAKLKGYRLEFAGYSRRWGGAIATIEPDESCEMWGAVWKIDMSNLASLDTQEGVHSGTYRGLDVNVTAEDGENLHCRTYMYILKEPLTGGSYDSLPESRRPSPLYLETILRGAAESKLPSTYQDKLLTISHNGNETGVTLEQFFSASTLVNRED